MVDAFFAVFQRPNFLTFVIIFLWGFYIMVTRYNLVKKLIGIVFGANQRDFFSGVYQCEEGCDGSRAFVNHGAGASGQLRKSVTSCLDANCYCGWRGDHRRGVSPVRGDLSRIWEP